MYLYKVEVKGMMCEHCEKHVNDALKKDLKAKNAVSSHVDNLSTFETRKPLEESKIKETIEAAGYEVGKIEISQQ